MTDYAEIAVAFAGEPVNNAEVMGWVNEFAYEGFSAQRIIQLVQERGPQTWQTDVKMMIVLALTRGNKPAKMIEKMSAEGKKKATRLITMYNLKSGNPGRDDLTLSRVASAFAGWTCQALAVLHPYLPVTGASMDSISPGYPRAMMHPSFAGLIDNSIPEAFLQTVVDAHALYLLQFSRVINKNMRGQPKSVVVSSFLQPMNAAIVSGFISHDKRRKMLMAFGIVDQNGKPTQAVETAAKAFMTIN
ncbi:nucleocapsid protein [Joa virus]|uniref:Nucleoprotein n=3 Tax=Phlebovirus TaxID=11584 RepID=A0A1S5SHV4_9VIRU|nr:nucleocapsid [Phlebovirus sp. Be Ar 371637]API68887.1 nucleocapsid protein [Joa virus]